MYTAANLSWWLALIAMLPAVAFGFLDSYYLRQERLFRKLYEDAIAPETEVPLFSMNTGKYTKHSVYPSCRHRNVLVSPTWLWLYGPMIVVGLILFGIACYQAAGMERVSDLVCNLS